MKVIKKPQPTRKVKNDMIFKPTSSFLFVYTFLILFYGSQGMSCYYSVTAFLIKLILYQAQRIIKGTVTNAFTNEPVGGITLLLNGTATPTTERVVYTELTETVSPGLLNFFLRAIRELRALSLFLSFCRHWRILVQQNRRRTGLYKYQSVQLFKLRRNNSTTWQC